MTWKNLITLNKRDWIGLTCWLLVSVLFGIICLPIMVCREIYQYKHFFLPRFEWEDIIRYSIVILLGSLINYYLITWIVDMLTT